MYLTIIVIVGFVTAVAESCTLIQPSADPDWSNMNKDWYDVLNMPQNGGGSIDCFHWLNMTGRPDGFFIDLAVSVEGYPSHSYRDFFDKKSTGVYEMSGDYVHHFIATAKKANKHQLDEQLAATIAAGPITWVKFPSKSPSITQIVDAWNALVNNNLMNTVQYNAACA